MATPTPTPGESELDNSSSINNLSSLLAEKGTVTSGTGDDDIETSSIEQLDWSEADEEELQLQEIAAAAAAAAASSTPPKAEVALEVLMKTEAVVKESEVLPEEAKKSMSKSGRSLSSSLLESMSSTVDSGGSSKKSVIENWASDVKDAVDRGEMEIEEESAEDFINDDEDEDSDEEMTVDEGANNEGTGMRKRMKRSASQNPMSISSFAVDSNIDPLSNAPVLDEGPIWNKGPKRYRFEENRRFNQKLTFGVLLAVVLAIGLGLGNLVAYNECEAEYKTAQPKLQVPSQLQNQPRKSEKSESSIKNNKIPSASASPLSKPNTNKAAGQSFIKNVVADLESIPDEVPISVDALPVLAKNDRLNDAPMNRKIVEEEPSIDSKYGAHMETLSKIVKTLDNLQRKIDKFENTSRHLGGVVVLKDSEDEPTTLETTKEEPSSLEGEVHEDIFSKDIYNPVPPVIEEEAEMSDMLKDFDEATERKNFIDKIIHGIEEINFVDQNIWAYDAMPNYEDDDDEEENENQLDRGFLTEKDGNVDELNINFKAYFEVAKKAEKDFILSLRDGLRERKRLGLAEERKLEDYTDKERLELEKKYNKYMEEFPFAQEVKKLEEQKKKRKTLKKSKNVEEDDWMEHFFDDWEYIARDFQETTGDDSNGNVVDDTKDSFTVIKTDTAGPEELYFKNVEKDEKAKKISRKDLQIEPRKDLKETKQDNLDNPWQDFSKGDEDEIIGKRMKREKSPKKEYSKKRKDKRGKNLKSQDDFEGSFSGQHQLDPNDNYENRVLRKPKKEHKDDDGSYRQKKSEKKKRNSKEYKESQPPNNYDYDDDDYKRKKFTDSNNKEATNKNNRDHRNPNQKEVKNNWLLERDIKENLNRELGEKDNSELDQFHHSSGKKVNNWQVERDRVREKVRSKNPKNKSYDD